MDQVREMTVQTEELFLGVATFVIYNPSYSILDTVLDLLYLVWDGMDLDVKENKTNR